MDAAVSLGDIHLDVDVPVALVAHLMHPFYLVNGALILDSRVQGVHSVPLYCLRKALPLSLPPDEAEVHWNWEANRHSPVAQNYIVAVRQDQGILDKDLEEDYRAVHIVSPGIHHKLQAVLQELLGHNGHMGVDHHTVTFVGLNLAFPHHTSYDVEVDPFLLMVQYLENVEDNHDQDLQEYQVAELV